jgi:hypothetical protein
MTGRTESGNTLAMETHNGTQNNKRCRDVLERSGDQAFRSLTHQRPATLDIKVSVVTEGILHR